MVYIELCIRSLKYYGSFNLHHYSIIMVVKVLNTCEQNSTILLLCHQYNITYHQLYEALPK